MPAVKTGTGPWGEAIKYWLPRRNMRNADLARATGIEEKTISKMARGFHTTTRKLEVVALALKVPLEQILVSPEQQRAHETQELMIREAVAAALRDNAARHSVGHDALEAAIEAQTRAEEASTPTVRTPTRLRKRKRHNKYRASKP